MKPRLPAVPAIVWITLVALLAALLLTWAAPIDALPAPGDDPDQAL